MVTEDLENKFSAICEPIPTWALCDEIGGDSELAYILDLTTAENYSLANTYLTEKCSPDYGEIDCKYIGKKVILEFDRCDRWYYLHGDIDEFFNRAKETFTDFLKRRGILNMTFEEARQRKDYKFSLNGMEELINDIRNNYLKDFEEDGDGCRGAAVLEIGYVDVELNIYTVGQCWYPGRDPEDKTPNLSYFTCLKHGESSDDWSSDDVLDYKINVDWNADNWKEQLETDMFKALNGYVENNGYSYDHAN
jgi:hypothetical protein